jgi:methylglutaconyl-CoA hydratase
MNADGVRCETRDDVLWLTLDRSGRRNAFDGAMLRALERALRELSPAVRAVVLTGAGTTFCAGADLEWMAGDGTLEDGVRPECAAVLRFYALLDAVPVPVVARVNGVAAGGGVGLAAVADLALAAEEATSSSPRFVSG